MEIAGQLQLVALAVLAATLVGAVPGAHAQEAVGSAARQESQMSGVRIQLDNDLFAGRERDRDYTGGLSITVSGAGARDGLVSLDPLLARLDHVIAPAPAAKTHHARQIGLIAFTPGDIVAAQARHDDRPYASLLFLSNARMRVDADDRGAWFSSLTVGVLGLSVSEALHSLVHEAVGSPAPRGYDYQISAGGEPSARYAIARQRLWIADPTGQVDVKTTLQGSVGYLTEASAAVTIRVGRFDSPWWGFAPDLTDYMAAPTPLDGRSGLRELYFFAGARVKARAYNAFLQGQFRDSEVRYSFTQIEPVLAEAWLGVVMQVLEHTELSYALRYQTAELRAGKAARDALWGGVQLAHAF